MAGGAADFGSLSGGYSGDPPPLAAKGTQPPPPGREGGREGEGGREREFTEMGVTMGTRQKQWTPTPQTLNPKTQPKKKSEDRSK